MTRVGAVYVFRKDGAGEWKETSILTADDGSPGDAFGRAIAISGDQAMVATWAHNENTGAAYVFRRDGSGTWQEDTKLTARDLAGSSNFGSTLALHGGRALIGAPVLIFLTPGPTRG